MKYLFAPAGREALRAALSARPLLAFDYDGTLAPITPQRGEASMRPRTRELLLRLAGIASCAIVSGRSREDMRPRVAGIPLAEIVGNHGMEPSRDEATFESTTQQWLPVLERAMRRVAGADIENKRLSLSIHYSRSGSPDLAVRDILAAVQQLGETAMVVRGHRVINVIPHGARLKSGAIRDVMAAVGARSSVFVGDDWTDEEAFRTLSRDEALTIRIARLTQSSAQYYLRSQDEVDDLLEVMVLEYARRGGSAWTVNTE